jgi:hypothetical protein
MSDTKWRKLFDAVNDSGCVPISIEVKFVERDEPEERAMGWPRPNDFWGPPQWVDTPQFGPIELRSIEWLMIPAIATRLPNEFGIRSPGVPQDLAAIKSALSGVGQFPLEESPEGLRIIGYR